MFWFWAVIGAQVLFSISNHIDRYLMSEIFDRASIGTLAIFSTIIGLPMVVIVFFMKFNVFNIGLTDAIILMFGGVIYAGAIMAYLYAMREDEASNVVPLSQMIPIFSFILGYVVLGETLNMVQIIGSLFILFGSTIIAIRYDGFYIKWRGRVIYLMVIATALWATMSLFFKVAAIGENFWVANFWEYVGMSIVALLLLVCMPSYRQEFMSIFYNHPKTFIGLNVINETLSICGLLIINYTLLLAPIALVSIASSIQPFIVLLLGVGITIFLPSIGREIITRRELGRKIFAIVFIIFGAYFINQ